MDDWKYVDYVKITFVCSMWYLCSTGANILGKMILLDFPYPMTVTMVQLLTISVLLGPILPCFEATKRVVYTRRYFVIMMLPLALGKFLSSVSTYISVWRVSVSYAHTVKATLPLFTVILAKIILGERQTVPVYLSLLPIITGVGVTTMTEVTYDPLGLLFALMSTLTSCLLNIFSKKCLKEVGYHHLQLLTIINRLAAACFLPLWVLADLPRILHNAQFIEGDQVLYTVFLLVCSAIFNMLNSVFAFTILAKVSPLSYSVANATKRIVIIGSSILILQNSVSPLNALGMLIAVFGVLSYNKAKYEQVQAARRKKLLPYVHSDSNLPRLGVAHIPHSKSDANLVWKGDPSYTEDGQLMPRTLSLVTEEREDRVTQIHDSSSHSESEILDKLVASPPVQDYFERPPVQLHSRGVHQI